MSFCKVIKEKYRPYIGEVVSYGHGYIWRGYYLSDSKLTYGVSFSQNTAFVSDEERESILNKYLIKHENSLRTKRDSLNYWYTTLTYG